MSIEVFRDFSPKFIKTFKKFQFITNTERPTFQNDFEYVDYALSVLHCRFSNLFEVFTSELDEAFDGLKKSAIDSLVKRNMGNVLFKAGHYFEAHHSYTLSIAYAECGSRPLALAYGDRSALLFEKQYYKECLEDINRALENNYPEEKKAQLLQLQVTARQLLPTQNKVQFHDAPPKIKNKNPNILSASDCIKINENEEFGRHIVAARNINPGEILLVEKPYSQSVHVNYRTVHCSECLEVCYNMIPCKKCAGVLYCTQACRRKAYVDYHRYECTVMRRFGFDVIDWNAIRTTLKGIKDYDKEYTDPNLYHSDRFKELSELKYHKIDCSDIYCIAKMAGAAKVFYALKNFTDILSEFDVGDKEKVLKSLLLSNLFKNQYNSLLVGKLDIDDDYTTFGRAIYSTTSLFNHACFENVGYSFCGSTVIVRAMKKIAKGEQCFLNYGVNPFIGMKMQRQIVLKESFHFTCKCRACSENWPKADVLSIEAKRLLPELSAIYLEATGKKNIDKHRENVLLQKTFKIIEKIEPEAPFLSFRYTSDIFAKILFKGNSDIPF